MTPELDISFRCMGTDVRLLVGVPIDPRVPGADAAAALNRAWLENYDRRLSRFRADSELSALNRDPRPEVPAAPLVRVAVRAALWSARATGGLVDPTLVGELERAGYGASRGNEGGAPLSDAIQAAPTRRAARPRADSPWWQIEVDDARGTIRRPPGTRLDTGGSGKGLAADAVAERLAGHRRFLVDCGGDLRAGGAAAAAEPYEVNVEHPLTGEPVHAIPLGHGAVATSGIARRLWRRGDGGFAHHLIDPSTGEPAWTGLLAVTALAPTALEAETIAKAAFLSGPSAARRLLRRHGGLLVRDDGDVETAGPLARPRVRVSLPGPVPA